MQALSIFLHVSNAPFSHSFPIIVGMAAAIAHVLMGPDHLAAVTPLVYDTQKRHWRIGFLWGIGHMIGMLLVGTLFYFFKDFIPIEPISKYSEQFVGFILIGLGFWSFYRIKNKRKTHKHPHFHDQKEKGSVVHIHEHQHEHENHEHKHDKLITQSNLTAIFVGTIHGFAGIAHFVLLLPVLGFDSKYESLQYIVGFAGGVLIAMVLYTALLGKTTKYQTKNHTQAWYFNFQFWSGLFAIFVGIYWIAIN